MAVTSKGQSWELRHSLWIAWTFTLGFFNWIAFFYIGIRAKRRRWLLWGLFYAIPFILGMAIADTPAFDGWVGDVDAALVVLLGLASIVHAFRVRKEYLLRLEALQRGTPVRDAALRRRIDTEYTGQRQTHEGRQATEGPPPDQAQDGVTRGPSVAPDPQPQSAPPADTRASAVDLNGASEQQLAALPGVGLIVAKRAVGLRESRSGFRSVDDFGEALNLKPHVVERLRPMVSVSPPQAGPSESSGRIVDF